MKNIKLGIPKGSLQEATMKFFNKAGFKIISNARVDKPIIDDEEIECFLIKAREIPKYVEQGFLDVGIVGKDWIIETASDVEEVTDLLYSKSRLKPLRLVVAVAEDSDIKTIKDLENKRIATGFVNISKEYLEKNNINAEVGYSHGATEVKIPEFADAIIELTDTGASIRANNLKIIDTILESSTRLIANKDSLKDNWKKEKIEEVTLLLKSAIAAEGKVGLKMNIEMGNLQSILKLLPALKNPTISELSEKGWMAIETIIDERIIREIIPKLKKVGARGIVEYPLNKVIK